MKKVLVAGATGYLGRFVVREFKKQGFWIRALARNTERIQGISEYIDETIIGEATVPKSLSGICTDIDILFSSIGITRQKDGLTYMDVDYQGNKNLLEEAKRESVSKIIYISVFHTGPMKDLKCIQAKIKFEEELKQSGLDYMIIRPNGFFSDILEYLKMAKKGRGYVFGSGENKINPIHGKDLAEVCVKAVSSGEKEIDVGGPDVYTHNEILEIAFRTLNRKARISRIPLWVKSLLTTIIRIFSSKKTYGPLEFFLTVLSIDMVAPKYGRIKIRDFFRENADNM